MILKKATLSKKQISILVGGIILLCLGAGYVYASIHSWNALSSSNASLKQAKDKLSEAVQINDAITVSERQGLLRTSMESNEFVVNCTTQWWYEWQQRTFSGLAARQEECVEQWDSIQSQRAQLNSVANYVEDEVYFVQLLTALKHEPTSDSIRKADWRQYAKDTKAVLQSIEKRGVSAEYEEIKIIIEKRVRVLSAAWTELLAADESQDSKSFEAAKSEVQNGYKGLIKIESTSNKALKAMLVEFKDTL